MTVALRLSTWCAGVPGRRRSCLADAFRNFIQCWQASPLESPCLPLAAGNFCNLDSSGMPCARYSSLHTRSGGCHCAGLVSCTNLSLSSVAPHTVNSTPAATKQFHNAGATGTASYPTTRGGRRLRDSSLCGGVLIGPWKATSGQGGLGNQVLQQALALHLGSWIVSGELEGVSHREQSPLT